MKSYQFALVLSGVAELTPESADALYAATQGDIELNLRDGVAFLEFERSAATLRSAITAAIREVEGQMPACASCVWNLKLPTSLRKSTPIFWG